MPVPTVARRRAPLRPPVDYYFDQGSAASWSQVDGTPTIRITPRKHWDNTWAFWAIRAQQWGGKTPHFLIAKADHYGTPDTGMWMACWSTSPDTDTWSNFDHLSIGATDIEFYNDAAFPSGMIYVSAMPMYPMSRVQRLMGVWGADSLVDDTPSTTNFILGNATARDNGDGRGIIPALPYYGFKLTNATANTKNTGVLTAGNHPSENIGRFMLEGAVEWLRTTSAKQKFLLDWFNFFIYPALNPQGIYGGFFRSDPQNPASDHNRLWDGTGVDEAIDAFKTAWNTDWANAPEVALDYHSWMAADGAKSVAYDSTIAIWVAFLAKMAALGTFTARADDTTASVLGTYFRSLATTKLNGTIDPGGITTMGVAEWKALGQNTMIALANLLAEGRFTNGPGVGSRSFDGLTNRIDWANPVNLTGQACTLSTWINPSSTPSQVNQYVFGIHDSGDTAIGILFNLINSGRQLDFVRHGASGDYLWYSSNDVVVTRDARHNVVITSDGGLLSSSVKLWLDGVSVAVGFTNGSGAETAHTGSLSLGGRIYSDTRNFKGEKSHSALWLGVLDDTKIANLAAGYAPDLVDGGTNLKFYWKGNTSSLEAVVGGTGTADGTTQLTGVGNGPAIIYG